ncbi:phosphatidate cytidylyltransferase [Aquimarina sp. 2201CG5-10]|uniref:phosphatidate cytidylyltransferase n=1 Tax=Aquimarina callyspongiae TaxID=3098150 RepID=UPI002AB54F87|nr:phosphatidate cytidylyltransferase [Aquimarina sp. 2201CG5-10]MDY8134234.1 phosphatidate cytidylyltransferase [Aquimarina sp. 2201CG5-10]
MKELLTRSLSGFLYVSILLISIFISKYTFIGVFLVFGLLCIYEFQKLIHLKNKRLYLIFVLFLAGLHYFENQLYVTLPILILTIITELFLVKDLVTIRIIPMFEKRKYLTSIFYLITSIVFLTLIPNYNGTYQPIIVAGALLMIWTNDTFAYLVGKNFGKHKLLERISPKKTIEGFIGGFLFTLLAGYLISIFTDTLSTTIWLIISFIMSIFGTLGDLIQSKFKRQAGVKDSGSIMPGHGGIFDRLDSIIFASPFLYAFLQILKYVP